MSHAPDVLMLMMVAGVVGVGRDDIKYFETMKNPLTFIS
jgi:hypothetical protein